MPDNNSKSYNILFVCLGNICRSPAAEGIMKEFVDKEHLSAKIKVDSAGTSGYHDGELPDPRMRQHGAKRGYNFNSLSRRFDAEDFDNFDLIITMDDNNYHSVLSKVVDIDSEKKVKRMTDFSQKYKYDHVPDPYYSGAEGFELVLDLLEDACSGLLTEVKKQL